MVERIKSNSSFFYAQNLPRRAGREAGAPPRHFDRMASTRSSAQMSEANPSQARKRALRPGRFLTASSTCALGCLVLALGCALGLLPAGRLARVDGALYRAKRAGRDRVEIAAPSPAIESAAS
jgi:hypothetical protein